MAPYVYIRNDGFTQEPTAQQPKQPFPAFVRTGPRAEDFVLDGVLDRLTSEATGYIKQRAAGEKPFFLYFALTAPHKPTLPHERFRGTSGLGPYGDFVKQVDWTVGQVLETLDETGLAKNTLVFYTSDNGSYMHRLDNPEAKDHVESNNIQGYRAEHHRSNGPLRGTKADIWEAGHRVPFFVRWPGKIEAGSANHETVCLTDILATCAEVTGAEMGGSTAEDSFSLLPALRGQQFQRGAPVVHHSAAGMFALRDGKWKLIAGNGSGGREAPKGKPFAEPFMLFDLSSDLAEQQNQAAAQPDVVKRLIARLEQIREAGRSR